MILGTICHKLGLPTHRLILQGTVYRQAPQAQALHTKHYVARYVQASCGGGWVALVTSSARSDTCVYCMQALYEALISICCKPRLCIVQ